MRTQIRISWLLTIVTVVLLCLSVSAQESLIRKDGEPLTDFCQRIVPAGMEFAHPPLQVKIGPVSNNIVVLFRLTDNTNENFTGWVLVPDTSNAHSYTKYVLPPMFEAPDSFSIEIKAVFGAQLANQAGRDLVVLYEYHRNGRPQDSGHASYVYYWTGKDFQLRDKLWEKLAGLRTASAVRQKLRTLPQLK